MPLLENHEKEDVSLENPRRDIPLGDTSQERGLSSRNALQKSSYQMLQNIDNDIRTIIVIQQGVTCYKLYPEEYRFGVRGPGATPKALRPCRRITLRITRKLLTSTSVLSRNVTLG